jgi:hypothetical protein
MIPRRLEFRERVFDELTDSLATAAFVRPSKTIDSIGVFLGETGSEERPNARRRAAHSTFCQRLFHLTKPPLYAFIKSIKRSADLCDQISAPDAEPLV